jgi:hypothetical protein
VLIGNAQNRANLLDRIRPKRSGRGECGCLAGRERIAVRRQFRFCLHNMLPADHGAPLGERPIELRF